MNLPNQLTVARMIMVPFFVVFLVNIIVPHHFLIAGLIFALASFTDFLDGKIARKYNLITNFGKFLDPLADKVLVISALVCFVSLGLAELWFVLIIIAREFMVTSIRLIAVNTGTVIAANGWGKLKTVSQMAAVVGILIMQYIQELIDLEMIPVFSLGSFTSSTVFWFAGNVLVGAAAFFTVISGIVYLVKNWSLFKNSKYSSAILYGL